MKKAILAIFVMVFGLVLQAQEFKSLDFFRNGSLTNGVKIKTNLPFTNSSQMPTVILEGYSYGDTESIGIMINWYVYNDHFVRYTATSYGAYTPEIKLAKENNKVVIYINDQPYFMRFQVRTYAKGLPYDAEANCTGWTWADEPLTGTNVVTVPYKAVNNNGWLNNGGDNVYNDKNVGIGTTTPDYKLEVNGTLGLAGHFTSLRSSSNTFLRSDDNGYTGYGSASSLSSGANILLYGKTSSRADNLAFRNSTGEKATILSNGNMGIGTTTPDEKLSVNGKIHTKEVKVDLTGWSDFVFYDDYKLPTLEEVENHINKKGHLKDIPSAKEVEDKGILLGEMNAKLLQKIEELTLYTIDQQKEIERLKTEVEQMNALKKENKELKALSKRIENLEILLQK